MARPWSVVGAPWRRLYAQFGLGAPVMVKDVVKQVTDLTSQVVDLLQIFQEITSERYISVKKLGRGSRSRMVTW